MTLKEIYKIADEIAPKRLSDEACQTYGHYDNSGILVDTGEEIKSILFSLDCSKWAIEEAVQRKADLLITHHPVIYGGIGDMLTQDTALGNKLIQCVKNGISVISMHLNLDYAKDGIDESLMQAIYLGLGETNGAGMRSMQIMQPLNGGGYGRVYDIPKTAFDKLIQGIKKQLGSEKVLIYGNKEQKITRVASFCGAGVDEESIRFAKAQGAQVLISSDFKHHLLSLAQEEGLSVVVLTHYASENYGFKKFYKKICQKVDVPCYYHEDENLI